MPNVAWDDIDFYAWVKLLDLRGCGVGALLFLSVGLMGVHA